MSEEKTFSHIPGESQLKEIGIYQYGFISTTDILFQEEVRRICQSNGCGQYGKYWACPPAVGTVSECKARCLAFENGMVFTGKYDLEDSFDVEGMQEGHKEFEQVSARLRGLLGSSFPYLLLSNEGCIHCETCTYPDAPCRMPGTLTPAVEGFGINVQRLSKTAKVRYINGPNTVTYFGLLLF